MVTSFLGDDKRYADGLVAVFIIRLCAVFMIKNLHAVVICAIDPAHDWKLTMLDLHYCEIRIQDGIACIYLNNPPVNALSEGLRNEIHAVLTHAATDHTIRALVFLTHDLPFSAGADIKEFSGPMKGKFFLDFYQAIEALDKPVIMGIRQYALGGGLEFCMMAHYRIAHRDARLGLPEVKLGLIPGGTGTMSLPRLVGVDAALSMAVSGQPVSAQSALEMGLIDAIAASDLESTCIEFAQKQLDKSEHQWLSPLHRPNPAVPSADYFQKKKAEYDAQFQGFKAPLRLLACIEASTSLPIDAGLRFEQTQFMELITGDDAAGMRYGFFAQRLASHVPGVRLDQALTISQVGVIGGGLMGAGISIALLMKGFSVVCVEADPERVAHCRTGIEQQVAKSVHAGKLTLSDSKSLLARLQVTQSIADVAQCDCVIEAVFEKMSLKLEIFKELDSLCAPHTILASNTSGLDLNTIAAATQRPEKVIGLHFFSPAHVMRLLEIVRGQVTSAETLATGLALAKQLKKIGVVVGVCPGFVGNRMIFKYFSQVVWLLLRGCKPQQIDHAVQQFGFAMGPCAMADMSGLDIWVHANPGERSLIHTLVEAGRCGQKTQAGFYDYTKGKKTPQPSSVADGLITDYARSSAIQPQSFTDAEIVKRLLCALIHEGLHILEEGIVSRASDIDTIYVHGYGFPIYRGGPMFYADQMGLSVLRDQLSHYRSEAEASWSEVPLLDEIIASGKPLHKFQVVSPEQKS